MSNNLAMRSLRDYRQDKTTLLQSWIQSNGCAVHVLKVVTGKTERSNAHRRGDHNATRRCTSDIDMDQNLTARRRHECMRGDNHCVEIDWSHNGRSSDGCDGAHKQERE